MRLRATVIGNEETFRLLGIETRHEIELEALIARLRKQFEAEYHDTEDAGQEILEGLQAVRDGRYDHRDWRDVLDEI